MADGVTMNVDVRSSCGQHLKRLYIGSRWIGTVAWFIVWRWMIVVEWSRCKHRGGQDWKLSYKVWSHG